MPASDSDESPYPSPQSARANTSQHGWSTGSYICLSKAAVTVELDFDPQDPQIVHACEPGDRVTMDQVGTTRAGQARGRIDEGWVSLISTEGNVLFELAVSSPAAASLMEGPFAELSSTLDQLEAGIGAQSSGEKRSSRPSLELPTAEARDTLFRRMDGNGNGLLSLAEIDLAVSTLYPDFDHKPVLMRAYKAADESGDGWIGQREFRQLMRYLVYFNQMWDAFEAMDADVDRRITGPEEFMVGCNAVGLQISAPDAQAQFREMDLDGSGVVRYLLKLVDFTLKMRNFLLKIIDFLGALRRVLYILREEASEDVRRSRWREPSAGAGDGGVLVRSREPRGRLAATACPGPRNAQGCKCKWRGEEPADQVSEAHGEAQVEGQQHGDGRAAADKAPRAVLRSQRSEPSEALRNVPIFRTKMMIFH